MSGGGYEGPRVTWAGSWLASRTGRPLTDVERANYGLADPRRIGTVIVDDTVEPDQQGDWEKRRRPWPTDMTVPCYTTRTARGIHVVWPCWKVEHLLRRNERRGHKNWPVEPITAQSGFDRGKGLCVCWDHAYGGERARVPGAEDGHRH